MSSLLAKLQNKAESVLKSCFGQELEDATEFLIPEICPSSSPAFGHYQCNNALKLSKILKKNPREVAQMLIAHWGKDDMLAGIEIAGPGFINLTVSAHFLSHRVDAMLHSSRLDVELPSHPQKIIVEFSSPNIAKELHVGHLRSTIIGDALARLFEFLGHHVLRLNHIGDWGTQFGMLITYMKEYEPDILTGKKRADLEELMALYRASKKKFDDDSAFKKQAQLEVVNLQSGRPQALQAWELICAISRKGFKELYDLLDVRLIERGESFYNPFLQEVVDDLDKKGLITISDGAKCIFLEGFVNREGEVLPMIIQKSDGGFNYDTTDVAALRHRVQVEKADRIIVVVDAGQSLHFQMVFKVAEIAGYCDPKKVQVEHVGFGVVLGTDGKKLKTRSGETVKLRDLLFEAIDGAKKILQERSPDLSSEELDQSARILGIDAVKYADLSCNRMTDYVFSYERMLRFDGNTAAFMLYAYVRIQSIKRKVGKEMADVLQRAKIHLEHPSEIALGLNLARFHETLDTMARDLLPNRLTEYLYTLAESFHAFFRDCRVEGTPQEDSRLLLCEAASRTLEKGLEILGLKTLERM